MQQPSETSATQSETKVSDKLIHIQNSAEFDTYFSKTDRLIVADLYADWCGPCKMIGPYIATLSGEYGDRADFLKINVDNNSELAQRFEANSIPLVLFIKNGKVLESVVGAREKDEYDKLIKQYL